MAWTAEDLFDSYSDGDLNGNNGGSNWTTAWSGSTEFDVQGTIVYQGAKAVSATRTGAAFEITRDFSNTTAGSMYIATRFSSTTTEHYFMLNEGTTSRMFIKITGGAIAIYDNGGGTYVNLATSLAADTWYVVNVEYDDGAQPNNYRARVNTGSWGAFSSWYQVNGGSYTNINRIRFQVESPGAGTVYYDTITPTDPVVSGPTNVASWNGVSSANISTYNGVSWSNVDSINTVT